MSKDTFYFSHDYNARNDSKIKKLLSKHKYEGYGIFWAIIEDLYNNANALPTDYDTIAYDLRADKKLVESIIKDFGLFVFEGEFFGSFSVQKRLEDRNSKSLKARESALKRWSRDANALRPESEPNAIKENKGKENKGKENTLVFPFASKDFKTAWISWKDYKQKEFRFKYKSGESEQASLNQLKQMARDEKNAINIIAQSMANGWKGFFPLKNNEEKVEKGKIEKTLEAGNAAIEYFKNKIQ